MLDLTNLDVRKEIGVSLEMITGNSYEFTDIIGTWSRENNYQGIIFPSARGTVDNKYFVNIILFDSSNANKVIKGKMSKKVFN